MQDVAEFINAMYKLKFNFHPDTWFEDYVSNDTGVPLFTPEAAQVYNSCLTRCFEICDWNDVDFYRLCLAFKGMDHEDLVCNRLFVQYRNETGKIENHYL